MHRNNEVAVSTLTSVFAELGIWMFGYLFGKRKNYTGRHCPDTIDKVPLNWHPEPEELRYQGLWAARFTRYAQYGFLRIPANFFKGWISLTYEIGLVVALSDWKWLDVPFTEWPVEWRKELETH
jgi:hypothetical protein